MSIRTVFTIGYIYNGSQIKQLIWWFTSSLNPYLAYVIFVYIFRMYSGVWTRALRSHAVAQFGWTGTDELSQCNTGSVSLPPGKYDPLSGCGLKNSTHNTCSILLESPGKKKNPLVITWPVQIFARSHEIFKFCNNLLGSACFLSKLRKWTDEAAGYYNPTPENTYRPFVTKDIDSIFFFNKNSFYDPPTPFSLSSFLCDSFKIFHTCTFKFPPFVFFLFFWQT